MAWDVDYSDEFGEWWESLSAEEQESIYASVGLLEQAGPHLPFPHSSRIEKPYWYKVAPIFTLTRNLPRAAPNTIHATHQEVLPIRDCVYFYQENQKKIAEF